MILVLTGYTIQSMITFIQSLAKAHTRAMKPQANENLIPIEMCKAMLTFSFLACSSLCVCVRQL